MPSNAAARARKRPEKARSIAGRSQKGRQIDGDASLAGGFSSVAASIPGIGDLKLVVPDPC